MDNNIGRTRELFAWLPIWVGKPSYKPSKYNDIIWFKRVRITEEMIKYQDYQYNYISSEYYFCKTCCNWVITNIEIL